MPPGRQHRSIGYLSHTDKIVTLYLQESLNFSDADIGSVRRSRANIAERPQIVGVSVFRTIDSRRNVGDGETNATARLRN